MHRLHSGYTVAVPIKNCNSQNFENGNSNDFENGNSKALRVLLKKLSNDNCYLTSFNNSDTTLFVSGVILPEQDYYGETLPETLVFATTFCGTLSKHLADLVQTNKIVLSEIFRHCEGFPKDNLISDADLIYYLRSHSYKSAFNSRYNCITKNAVEKEKLLRKEIEDYLDKAQRLKAFDNRSALQVKTLIQRHIATRGEVYEWCHKPYRKNIIELCVVNRVPLTITLLLLVLLGLLYYRPRYFFYFMGIFIAFSLVLLAIIYYISRAKNDTAIRPNDSKLREIAASQLRPILNEMTAAAPLKKGRLRRFFYAIVLKAAHFFAPLLMKVPTVSNVRWLAIDNNKRLVFLSNFTNTTDFYVRDFLNGKIPRGVNFLFTNGEGFPDAKMLVVDGITKDPEGYMNAVHTGQHVTDLWYAHEPNLTSDIINKNRKIRNGLFKKMTEEEANQWLKLL